MNSKDLILANIINKDIRALDLFISNAEKVWKGKLTKQTSKYIFKSVPYGVFDEAEDYMDTETKDKVLNLLREKLEGLKSQLNNI